MLAAGQPYPKRNPKDYKCFSSWLHRILFCENPLCPRLGLMLEATREKVYQGKCYLITEVAEFPLCSEGKCYRSVIALPSMCDLQDLGCVEFPKASVFKYRAPPTGHRVGGRVREDSTSALSLPLDAVWLGTKTVGTCCVPQGLGYQSRRNRKIGQVLKSRQLLCAKWSMVLTLPIPLPTLLSSISSNDPRVIEYLSINEQKNC